MKPIRLLASLIVISLFCVLPAQAQETPKLAVSDLGISYVFGSPITFQARLLNLPGPVSEAHIFFRSEGETITRVAPVSVNPDGLASFTYTFDQGPLRPFAQVRYSYQVKLQDGQEFSTEEFFFPYVDNRFPWKEREAEGIHVHWYAGEASFGQDALDVARQSLQRGQDILITSPTAQIDVFIYASLTDLQQAFETGGATWAGGHASPDLRVALVSIAPGPEQGLEMDREIPHELAHILTYDLTQEHYSQLPVWLREGIASHLEISTNPDYPRAIAAAAEKNTLISFNSLCNSFPADSGSAFLAYAQSESFTNYFIDTYGQTALIGLIQAYGDGLDCEQGATRTIGKSLTQLQVDWESTVLGINPGLASLGNFAAYLTVFGTILIVALLNAFLTKGGRNAR